VTRAGLQRRVPELFRAEEFAAGAARSPSRRLEGKGVPEPPCTPVPSLLGRRRRRRKTSHVLFQHVSSKAAARIAVPAALAKPAAAAFGLHMLCACC